MLSWIGEEDRLSFFINLEVVIFQGRNPTFIFLENSGHPKLLWRFTNLYNMLLTEDPAYPFYPHILWDKFVQK